MALYLSLIVEGHSEAEGASERLLQRVWKELLGEPFRLQVLTPPSRCQRDAFTNPNHPDFTSKIEEAALKLAQRLRRDQQGRGLLLILLDAERDCPATLAPRLLASAQAVRRDIDITCVLAKSMLENWIVAGASTLAGVHGLPNPLPTRDNPEEGSGANWLEKNLRAMDRARKYKKTVDAEVFVRVMALQECRDSAPSFDKLCRELEARLPLPPPPEPPPPVDAPTE